MPTNLSADTTESRLMTTSFRALPRAKGPCCASVWVHDFLPLRWSGVHNRGVVLTMAARHLLWVNMQRTFLL